MRDATSYCGRLSIHVRRGVGGLVVLIAGHVMANVNVPQSSDTSLTFWATRIHVWNNAWVSSGWLMAVTSYGSSIPVFYVSFLIIWDVRLGTRFGVLTVVLLRIISVGMWHCVVGELLGCGTVLLASCWGVALCRWWAVGMWHCVVVRSWDVALCRWADGMWRCVVGEGISALRGSVVHSSWDVKQSKNKYFCFETSENLHLIRYSVWYWKSWTVREDVLIIGRNEKWYRRYWCRSFESGEFEEGGGRCLSCGSGEEAELSASTGCVESVLTSAYFLVCQTVTVASDPSYLWT